MGRGRAKAKQTKVARDLKYRTYSTDFSSLERELRGGRGDEDSSGGYPAHADPYDEDDADPYDDLSEDDEDVDDDDFPQAGAAYR